MISFSGRGGEKRNFDFHFAKSYICKWVLIPCDAPMVTLMSSLHFLKYFNHPPLQHQLKNVYHVLKNPFMQRKMHLESFGIQKSIGNWNPEIPGTNAQNHSNWALSLYELYGTNKHA